jgi:CTP:molybdopterin cytidylyltransferase MocA
VLLPKRVVAKLGSASAKTLREFLSGCEIRLCPSADPGLELDLDRPEDYERALRLVNTDPGRVRGNRARLRTP